MLSNIKEYQGNLRNARECYEVKGNASECCIRKSKLVDTAYTVVPRTKEAANKRGAKSKVDNRYVILSGVSYQS